MVLGTFLILLLFLCPLSILVLPDYFPIVFVFFLPSMLFTYFYNLSFLFLSQLFCFFFLAILYSFLNFFSADFWLLLLFVSIYLFFLHQGIFSIFRPCFRYLYRACSCISLLMFISFYSVPFSHFIHPECSMICPISVNCPPNVFMVYCIIGIFWPIILFIYFQSVFQLYLCFHSCFILCILSVKFCVYIIIY